MSSAYRSAALVLIALLASAPSHWPAPAGHRGERAELTAQQVCPLECRFLPILRFHPQEQYFPATPEWYFERVALRREGRTAPVLGVGHVTASAVGARTGSSGRATYLDIPNGREAVRSGDRNLLGAYAHIVKRDGSGQPSEIQY
jgi:hypothetical protein